MVLKKKTVSRKKSARKSRARTRTHRGGFRRFLRTVSVSAFVSFSLASYLLHPQWRSSINLEPVFNSLSLERLSVGHFDFDIGRFIRRDVGSFPVAVGVDDQVSTSFAHCPQFFPHQPPVVPASGGLRELCFDSFAILHHGKMKTPVFVAQRLNRQMLSRAQHVQRTDRFYAEARLPKADRAELADYRGSGYSRGHMAPAGDMHNDRAMEQSFSLANMVPQDQTHNAGAWNRIENDTRKYVMRAPGDVYIFTGPVYGVAPETIGDGSVAVPDYLYKLVYDATSGRSWVHWLAHHADAKAGRPISYPEFVERTGLALLPHITAN